MDQSKVKFNLSQKNIQELPYNNYVRDFTFIVNDREYPTSRIVADLLSPTIRRAHLTDSTLNKFHLNISNLENANNNTDYFTDFLNLVNFQTNDLDSARICQYSNYFFALGNYHEYIRLQMTALVPLTNENSIWQLSSIFKPKNESEEGCIQIDYDDPNIEEMISYISSHFYEINIENVKELPASIIERIVSNSSLQISSEDSLLQFAIELYLKDSKFSSLFEYVLFNNVSEKVLQNFISIFSLDDINASIWKSICLRLFPAQNLPDKSTKRYHSKIDVKKNNNVREFKFTYGKEFSGIFKYLTDTTHGNIHDNGTVEITSNSFQSEYGHPKNLVDYEENNSYSSDNQSDVFIQFDFKDRSVQLTDYSIQSTPGGGANWVHLRSWVIEASNDGNDWEDIDRHSNDQSLNGQSFKSTFKIQKETNEFYRFIRLKQTGCSWYLYPNDNNYSVWIQSIEFFGKLQEP